MTAGLAEPKRRITADEAREVAEAAREQEWAAPSFVRELFLGNLRMDLIHPYPEQDPDEVARAKPFLDKLERFLREEVDSDKIDREGEIPETVIQGLRDLGAFGIKIPREYGGLDCAAVVMKAIELVSSVDAAHRAARRISRSASPSRSRCSGPTRRKKYFPRPASGAISAFALTEHAGSDPAAMEMTATGATTTTPDPERREAVVHERDQGRAPVVMARTPSKLVKAKRRTDHGIHRGNGLAGVESKSCTDATSWA
jgi:hypothetical protein